MTTIETKGTMVYLDGEPVTSFEEHLFPQGWFVELLGFGRRTVDKETFAKLWQAYGEVVKAQL